MKKVVNVVKSAVAPNAVNMEEEFREFNLDKLYRKHLLTFDRYLIDGEIWHIKHPKNLNAN